MSANWEAETFTKRADLTTKTSYPRLRPIRMSCGTAIVCMRSGLVRAGVFALLWWILTEDITESWPVGAPVVLLTTLVSMALSPPLPWSFFGIAQFLPFFIWHSLHGGVDMAWRAFHPKLPIDPGLIDYPLRLPPGMARVFMINTVSLLPGTLSAELIDNCLKVHVIDIHKDALSELMAVEHVVSRIFNTPLQSTNGLKYNEKI